MTPLLTTIQQSQPVYRLGWALLHSLWLGAAIGALFALALLLLRKRSANARYLAACAALGGVCLALSPIPAAAMASYPLLKRFTSLCHLGIGACLALAPLGAFVAASGTLGISTPVVLLAVFTFAWMSGFDIIYALQDIDSDRLTGVRSLPAALGARAAGAIAAALHVLAALAGAGLWLSLGATTLSGLALGVMGAGFLVAHWPTLSPATRFFPVGPIVAAAGALVAILGEIK